MEPDFEKDFCLNYVFSIENVKVKIMISRLFGLKVISLGVTSGVA
jgi:hypothetical protein